MNISVGLMEHCVRVEVELFGQFVDIEGKCYAEGRHCFEGEAALTPSDPGDCSFALDEVTIGIGFHWERRERQVFRGSLRIVQREGLTVINDVPLEEYVASVISSEMSAHCPLELLKAHAVISRSWLCFPKLYPQEVSNGATCVRTPGEVSRWYGREVHTDFDVCADDHCQRYQGITRRHSDAVSVAVHATRGEMLVHSAKVCDARFSKCCGGTTEEYRTAWDDREVPYLVSVRDGEPPYCDTSDRSLLSQILPGFDQETLDFFRWCVVYSGEEIRALVQARLAEDLGRIRKLEPLERGPSGRIIRLRIVGESRSLIVGKELEIRRALSRTHLYSSAFTVDQDGDTFVLNGVGWGHGVGLCQIGAAVMASRGKLYDEILFHYYPGATLERRRV